MKTTSVSSSHRHPLCAALAVVLREQRLKLGLSRYALAQRAHLARQTIANLEQCLWPPTVDTLARLGDVFGLSAAWLLARAEERRRAQPALPRPV